jgi:cytochrome P450
VPGTVHKEVVLDLAKVTKSPHVSVEYRKILDTGAAVCPAIPLAGAEYTAIVGYEEIREVAGKTSVFSSAEGMTIPPLKTPMQLIPVELDPPEHTTFRRFLMPQLRKDRIEGQDEVIRRAADQAIDQFIEEGEGDLNLIGRYLPPAVISQMLGVPQDADIMVSLTERLNHAAAIGDQEARGAVNRELAGYVSGIVADAEGTDRDDLLGVVANADVNGEPIGRARAVATILTIVIAGQETTVHGISSLIALVGNDPEIKQELIDDPSLIPAAVEEALRLESPVQMIGRTLTEDAEVAGCPVFKGKQVGLVLGAANANADVFEDPEEFRLDRGANPHLAFGFGVHRCIGEHLARAEMKIALEQVLARIPDFEITGEVTHDASAPFNRGVLAIPARFTPGPRVVERAS